MMNQPEAAGLRGIALGGGGSWRTPMGGAVARFKYCFSGFHYSLVACLGDVHFAITRDCLTKGLLEHSFE